MTKRYHGIFNIHYNNTEFLYYCRETVTASDEEAARQELLKQLERNRRLGNCPKTVFLDHVECW